VQLTCRKPGKRRWPRSERPKTLCSGPEKPLRNRRFLQGSIPPAPANHSALLGNPLRERQKRPQTAQRFFICAKCHGTHNSFGSA
jgi:hypothetical protein